MSNIPAKLNISVLLEGYRRGVFTPRDVIREIIERVAQQRSKNIWITEPNFDRIATYLNRLPELDIEKYPLWGIPFAVKDNIEVADWPITAGCPSYEYVAKEHAAVVAKLVAAGAIPIGKTNLDQFATGLVGTRSPYGETKHAFNDDLISGGSSSGSAVAVALGQVSFALGTDTAGSGRVPASLHGLIGYKPAVGAWSNKGLIPACRSIDCITVFTELLEESVLVDSIVRGYDEADPYSRPVPLTSSEVIESVYLPAGELEFYGQYADEYRAAWHRFVADVKNSNLHTLELDCAPLSEAASLLYDGPLVAERWSALGDFIEENPGAALEVTETILRTGDRSHYTAAKLFQAQHRLKQIKAELYRALQDKVLIMPTCGGTWRIDEVRADPIKTNSLMGLYTNHCNLLDLSAIAIPCGMVSEGLPFGITLFGLPQQEQQLQKLAQRILALYNEVEYAKVEHEQTIEVAVCGLHMRGMPLESQMQGLGAQFVKQTMTAPEYRLFRLATMPAKPGLVKVVSDGDSIKLEVWRMSAASFGKFVSAIPAPLGFGKVKLIDGSEVSGFLCEAYATEKAQDITEYGGWREALLVDQGV